MSQSEQQSYGHNEHSPREPSYSRHSTLFIEHDSDETDDEMRSPSHGSQHVGSIRMRQMPSTNFPSSTKSSPSKRMNFQPSATLKRTKQQKNLKIDEQQNRPRLKTRDTESNLEAVLLSTGFDSNLDINAEHTDISRAGMSYQRTKLTFDYFVKTLHQQPHTMHISTHGHHRWWEYKESPSFRTQFEMAFEETTTLLHLVDDDRDFSAYYAMMTVLFEMEIHQFVHYGFKHKWSKARNIPRERMMTYIHNNKLLQNSKIYALLKTVCDRYGCHCGWSEHSGSSIVQIFWGRKVKEQWLPPHIPMSHYLFIQIYQEDPDVQDVLNEIVHEYNISLHRNVEAAQKLNKRPWRQFSWEIMFILLIRKLTPNGAIPNDFSKEEMEWKEREPESKSNLKIGVIAPTDNVCTEQMNNTSTKPVVGHQSVDKLEEVKEEEEGNGGDGDEEEENWDDWLDGESTDDDEEEEREEEDEEDGDEEEEEEDGNDDSDGGSGSEKENVAVGGDHTTQHLGIKNDPDEFESECSDLDFGEQDRITEVKIRSIQDLTKELKVLPKGVNAQMTPEEIQKLTERLSKLKAKLVHALRKEPEIQILCDFSSNTAVNVHIIRFVNTPSVQAAQNKIAEIQKRNAFWSFEIQFRSICDADVSSKEQVGFIRETQPKNYQLDVRRQTDPISWKLRDILISRTQCRMKLVVLTTCHSYILGKPLSEYVENVICVHPYVQIMDKSSTRFTKEFYSTFYEKSNSKISLSQQVITAFTAGRKVVEKKLKQDMKCKTHSHLCCNANGTHNHKDARHRHQKLHFGKFGQENWDKLQSIMDSSDDTAFKKYRSKMKELGLIPHDELTFDLHDGKTLKLCNVSRDKLAELKRYLSDDLGEEEMKEHDISGRDQFVVDHHFRKDPHFEELSVGYFKFQSKAIRDLANKKLWDKQKEECIAFSDRKLREQQDDHKTASQKEDERREDLGWYHRVVPRCCCSPQHPHLAQDKLILIQNGRILNRQLIDFSDLPKGKKWRTKRVEERERRAKQQRAGLPLIDAIDDHKEIEVHDPNDHPLLPMRSGSAGSAIEEEGHESCSGSDLSANASSNRSHVQSNNPSPVSESVPMGKATESVSRQSSIQRQRSDKTKSRIRKNNFNNFGGKSVSRELSKERSVSNNESEFGLNAISPRKSKRNDFGKPKKNNFGKKKKNDFGSPKGNDFKSPKGNDFGTKKKKKNKLW